MNSKEISLKYWEGAQFGNLDQMGSAPAEDVQYDSGFFKLSGKESLLEAGKRGSLWKKVDILEGIYTDKKGIIVYEGIEESTGNKTRVTEVLSIENNKIFNILSTVAQFKKK